jgi:hypothetical protein
MIVVLLALLIIGIIIYMMLMPAEDGTAPPSTRITRKSRRPNLRLTPLRATSTRATSMGSARYAGRSKRSKLY